MKKPTFLVAGSVFLLCAVSGCGPTRFSTLISREILFGHAERSNPQISPDGRFLTYLAPDKENVLQIWMRTFGKEDDRQLTSEKQHGVQHYTWTYDGEHLIFALDVDGDENWNIHTVNIRSGAVRNLTPFKGVQAYVVAMEPGAPEQILVATNLRNRRFHEVYRIDIRTGNIRLDTRNPGRHLWWVADSRFNVRAAAVPAGWLIREGDGGRWRVVRRAQVGEQGALFGLSKDEKFLYIRGLSSGDTARLLKVEIESGNETVVAADSDYDLEDVLMHPVSRVIQAAAFYKERLEWQVLDPSVRDDFAALAKVCPGEFSPFHRSGWPIAPSRALGRRDLADKTWIVTCVGDNGPILHYAYDRGSRTATLLFSERRQLEGLPLAGMRPIAYPTRDGLTVHGYLTLPVGVPPKNLPAVLLVHGGPWSRDKWGYSATVQWLANRGYAVLQSNYRGSTGYGQKFLTAGFKEWGGKMHDDLVDGVNWLVKEGIADPKRVAIMGGSYGGYATLVGLTLTPEVFTVGVSNVGISNLLSFYKNRPPYWSPYNTLWARRVGDLEKDAEMLKSRSPLFFVAQVRAPLMIAHGKNDARVVAAESEQMVKEMRRAGKQVEYVVYEDEGHRMARPENKYHFYARAEEFLAKHLGGRFEPAGELKGHAAAEK